ncbi:MAG: NADH-quinone oxidoreductase subunit NuoH [Polyangiaceae bacterium]
MSLLTLFSVGCKRGEAANLLDVIDVAPREVEVGDTIEVLGTGLPSGNVKAATVTFEGQLFRPGQDGVEAVSCVDGGTCIRVEGAKPTPDKVSFAFTEGLQTLFCGAGEEARHTTFRGDVVVTFPSAVEGGQDVQGRVVGIAIDFRPPSARRVVLQEQENQGRAALAFMGIVVDDSQAPASGGLRIGGIEPSSPAEKAGLAKGDVVVAFNGVTVTAVTDMIPGMGQRLADISIMRGSEDPIARQIDVEGFNTGMLPADILAALLILGIAAGIIALFMAPTAGIITWVERRVSGRMQSRIGPNRAGPQGFLVWIADGIKSIMKEDIIPTESDEALFRLAPYLVFIGVSATFVVMPFGQYLIAADLDIGILFVIAVTSLVAIGLMTGGWASNNKWSLLGGIRAAAQVISYEIPAAVSVVCIVMMTGSLRMQEIIAAQGGMGDAIWNEGGWPWYWYVFRNPVAFLLFFLFFTTALAEGNRAPFDLPEAESELVAGYSTEYSGMRYLFFFFAEWANVFVFCGIASALFLGGWQVPGFSPADLESNFGLQILGTFLFLLKSWILIFVVIWIRWTLPRVRIDQLMNLCWKWFVPLSFLAFLLTALWVMGTSASAKMGESGMLQATAPLIPTMVQLVISVGTFAVFVWLCVYFAKRVSFNVRASKIPVHLNPFL